MSDTLAKLKVRVGDATPWGPATALCGTNPADFLWACAVHGVAAFDSIDQMREHIVSVEVVEPCRIAMRCRADGLTHGWTALS